MVSESTVSVEQQLTASHDTVIKKSTEMTVELKAVLRYNRDINLKGLTNTMTNAVRIADRWERDLSRGPPEYEA